MEDAREELECGISKGSRGSEKAEPELELLMALAALLFDDAQLLEDSEK